MRARREGERFGERVGRDGAVVGIGGRVLRESMGIEGWEEVKEEV